MKNIMVDLETFGTRPYSTIISIGAVYFDPMAAANQRIKSEFYVTIDPEASEAAGFRTDASTIGWWLDPARSAVYKEWFQTVHLQPQAALFGFGMWLGELFDLNKDPKAHDDVKLSGDPSKRDTFEVADHIAMWGNGAGFDNVLLRQAYELMKMDVPWRHWNDRCFRTLKNLTQVRDGGDKPDWITKAKELAPPHEGLHNALLDARQQALWLCNIASAFDLEL